MKTGVKGTDPAAGTWWGVVPGETTLAWVGSWAYLKTEPASFAVTDLSVKEHLYGEHMLLTLICLIF